MIARAMVAWALLMAAESLHGIARVALLQPLVGDAVARRIAVGTGCVIILLLTLAMNRWIAPPDRAAMLRIGLLWAALTVGFELALGRLLLGASWERILSDYDLVHGGLMPLGLAFMALSPWLAARLQGWPEARS